MAAQVPSTASSQTRTLLLSLGSMASAIAGNSAAEAQVVVKNENVTLSIDGAVAAGSLVYSLLPGGLNFYGFADIIGNSTFIRLSMYSPTHSSFGYFRFYRSRGGSLNSLFLLPAGVFYDSAGPRRSTGSVVDLFFSQSGATRRDVTPTTTLGYLDFVFGYGSFAQFGWVSLTVDNVSSTQYSVTVDQIAYSTTFGQQLASGDTGVIVPEPDSAGMLAVGMLVLGAAGTRRFRRRAR